MTTTAGYVVGNGNPEGSTFGASATALVSFYGATPIVQRTYSSAVHATSAASVSSSFGATQLAILQEVMTTLNTIGIWATA